MEALNIYDQNFDNWSWNQRNLFWRQVVGFTQRFVPACYAQAFSDSRYFIFEENKPLSRSLAFKYSSHEYYPLPVGPVGLGFDFAVDFAGVLRVGHGLVYGGGARCARLKNYVEQIQQNYLDLGFARRRLDSLSMTANL